MSAPPLRVYYLDEPLTDEERQFAEDELIGPWATFKTGAKVLDQRRVPMLLPVGADYISSIQMIRGNLRKAGIADDRGRQVCWIGTNDVRWTSSFMMAIFEETGFHPFFLKRWFPIPGQDDFELARGELQIIDSHGLMGG